MKFPRFAAACTAVLGCALLALHAASARETLATVDAWTSQTTPRVVVGPVDVRIRFNALHYARVSTTVAIVKKDPPDFGPVIAAISGFALPGRPTSNPPVNTLIAIDVEPDPCSARVPEPSSGFKPFFNASIAAGKCFVSLNTEFASNAKAVLDELDAYHTLATDGDTYLVQTTPPKTDDAVVALVACANRFGRDLGAALGGNGKSAGDSSVKLCPGVSSVVAAPQRYPAANSALVGFKSLAQYIANVAANADAAFGTKKLSKEQRDVIVARMASIPIDAYVASGEQAAAYRANYASLTAAATRLAANSTSDFVYEDRTNGNCSRDEDGEKRTITAVLFDRFEKPDAAPVKKDLLAVDCLSRNAVSAGAGYTGLRGTSYALQQTFAANATTSTIVKNDDVGQFAAAALAHRCLCRHPEGTVDVFASAGVISSGKSPLGLFGGLSTRFAQRYFVNLGLNYGTEATLTNGTLGQIVPNDFKVSMGKQLRLRPALMITIGK